MQNFRTLLAVHLVDLLGIGKWPSASDAIRATEYLLKKEDVDPAFFNDVSQIAHFTSTFSLTLLFCFFVNVFWYAVWMPVVPFALCTTYAAWHEFIHDPKEENPVTRGSDLEDFLFLVTGSFTGIFCYWLYATLQVPVRR